MYKFFNLLINITKILENIFQALSFFTLIYLTLFTIYSLFLFGKSDGFDFFKPVAKTIISMATPLWPDSNSLIQDFILGVVFLGLLLLFFQFAKHFSEYMKIKLKTTQENYRIHEDKVLNQELKKDIINLNKKITKCIVYYEVKKKDKIRQQIDIEEQYQILNQFFYSKTNIVPEKHEDGYILNFSSIENIDTFIPHIFKAINSTAPVEYIFILQVVENSIAEAHFEIKKLINAKLYNKIIMTPTTNLRYEHNKFQKYTTTVTGNFVFAGESHSIFEIRDNYLQ